MGAIKDGEGEVVLEDLDAALENLVKAADIKTSLKTILDAGSNGEPLVKGSDGNVASMSDAGPIQTLMIGKWVKDLESTGMSQKAAMARVGQFLAFMEVEVEDESDDEEEEGMGKSQSFAKSFHGDTDIAEGLEASAFMEAITQRTIDALDGLGQALQKSDATQAKINKAIANTIVEQSKLIKSLTERLGVVESTPLPAKGKTTAQALTKALPGEAGAGQQTEEPLSFQEAARVLSYMRFEKSMSSVCGQPTGQLAIQAENRVVTPDTLGAVRQFLKSNPAEANAAKNY